MIQHYEKNSCAQNINGQVTEQEEMQSEFVINYKLVFQSQ